jgi:phosphoserine phosphatase
VSTKQPEAEGNGRLRLVVFDMDGVLVDHFSSWAVVHEALGTDNTGALLEFLDGRIDDHEFIRRDVALWRAKRPGLTEAEFHEILSRAPRMPGLVEAIRSLRAQGTRCAIVSGGLRPLAEMVAREAGFDAVRANGVCFGTDGVIADGARVEVPLRQKGEVVQALQDAWGIDREHTGAVGDSEFDRGLFMRSRVSVAFNALDPAVASAATHAVWEKDLRAAVECLLDGARVAR